MIHLNLSKEPYWLDIIPGARVFVRPINSVVHEAAQATAERMIGELMKERQAATEVGAALEGMPDLDDPDVLTGLRRFFYKKALARHAIIAWEGFADRVTREPAPVTPETVGDFMMIPGLAGIFYDKYYAPLELLVVEKKGSGTAPDGTGSRVAVPDTAPAAVSVDSLAPPAAEA